ncbi:MAG: hydrogenase maturation nickel metallochaperone HypA [Clostridia bacterium]|nr:hydrogenase maturation nickel metallochaperone HypA [Clostridia bacterium]
MHELGVLCQAVGMVSRLAGERGISHVRHMTLSVGEDSGYVPAFFEKLFPVAVDRHPVMRGAKLKMEIVPGRGLQIKDFGY